jgi:photosystem II stability/assembly factor-like uncharacterized protein
MPKHFTRALFNILILSSGGESPASDSNQLWEPVPVYSDEYRPRLVKEGFQMTHALSFAPSDPSIAYLCTDTSQVWRSSNGGQTWKHVGNGMATNGCRSLAVDPVNPERVLAAGFLGVNKKVGKHRKQKLQALYLTEDGGRTWQLVRQANFFRQISKAPLIAYDSSTSDREKTRVWYVGIYDEGLFVSEDGGLGWTRVSRNLTRICDLKEIPGKPGQLLIASESGLFHYKQGTVKKIGEGLPKETCAIAIHPADSDKVIAAAGEKGIYRSTNGGLNFSESNRGLPMVLPNLVSLGMSQKRPYVLYAKAHMSKRRLPFYSEDGGVTWEQGRYGAFAQTRRSQQQFWFSSAFAPHPSDPKQCLVVSSGSGKVFKTSDGGATWDLFGTGYTGARVMDMVSDKAGIILALTDFGLWTSRRGDVYFRDLQIPRFKQASSVHLVGKAGDTIVATVGTWHDQCVAVRQPKGDWKLYPKLHGRFRFLAVHPRNFNEIYIDDFRSLDGGNTWARLSKTVAAISGDVATKLYALEGNTDNQWTSIFVSEDGGERWRRAAPPVQVTRSRINGLVLDPHYKKRFYLATNDGVRVFDGKEWSKKSDKEGLSRDIFGLSYVSVLIADPARPGRLFAGKAAPGRGMSNGIFTSNDSGETWVNITGNLGRGAYVWSLHVDAPNATLYAGTALGLHKLGLDYGEN